MRQYFEKMDDLGRELRPGEIKRTEENVGALEGVEKEVDAAVERVKTTGFSTEKINDRGQMTVWQRIEYLVEPGTWCPLHTLYNPLENPEDTTNVIDGIGRIGGRWAVVIGFDNKVFAGAWMPGQPENILRVTQMSKRLNLPLVWLVNCSGAKLPDQEKFYANRRGAGTPFYRHAELEQLGIPILAGIYGTNPAGGGYQGISPTVLFAHKNCNIAVGGAGIVSGMAPKGHFDTEMAQDLIESAKEFRAEPPGTVKTHFDETGFFKYVFEEETGVLDALKEYMAEMPAYAPRFFRVAEPAPPKYPADDLYNVVPLEPKRVYDFEQVLARLVDGSEHTEFRPDYGPEVYTGLCKIDGFLVGVIGNRQGYLGKDYPEYGDYPGIGGKLYRQGLIKMNEFVTLCGRDRIPLVWIQDTSGIDVGEAAEKAELLGLGQGLIYSIQQTDLPMMCLVLRKASAAAHYLMGGPPANRHNAFTLGTAASEVYVMHGETAAVATYVRRLIKEDAAGRPLEPVVEQMNELAEQYHEHSRPVYCARYGMLDEIVKMGDLRRYLVAFAGAVYQNPRSICPHNHMVLPRVIRG